MVKITTEWVITKRTKILGAVLMFLIIVFLIDLIFDVTGGPVFGRLMAQVSKVFTKSFWVNLGRRSMVFFKSITKKQLMSLARLAVKHNLVAKLKALIRFFILTQLLSYEPLRLWMEDKKFYLLKKKDQLVASYKKHPWWFKGVIIVIVVLIVLFFSLYSLALWFVPVPGKSFFRVISASMKKLAGKLGLIKISDAIFGILVPAKAREKWGEVKEKSTQKVADLKLVEKGHRRVKRIKAKKAWEKIGRDENRPLPPEYYENLNPKWLKNALYAGMILFIHANMMMILISIFE